MRTSLILELSALLAIAIVLALTSISYFSASAMPAHRDLRRIERGQRGTARDDNDDDAKRRLGALRVEAESAEAGVATDPQRRPAGGGGGGGGGRNRPDEAQV